MQPAGSVLSLRVGRSIHPAGHHRVKAGNVAFPLILLFQRTIAVTTYEALSRSS